MGEVKKELEMLKSLPVLKRIEILEERVIDLEELISKYNTVFKSIHNLNNI